MYTFPPTPPKPDPDNDSDTTLDTDKSRKRLHSTKSSNGTHSHVGNSSLQSLQLQQHSTYFPIDGTRGHNLPSSQEDDLAAKRVTRLPTTTTLNADLRTINQHLALRTKEIIACSESMWEWVEQFQRESASIPKQNTLNWSLDLTRCAILDMNRDDFDILMMNFTM